MALITRISRLFQADFHAVLDRIEEPEQLLKQAIREMEDELAAAETRVRVCTHELKVLNARRSDLANKLRALDAELDLCFASGKEELARRPVHKKLETERLLARVNAKLAASEAYLADQNAALTENRAALDGLKQKAELFAEHRPTEEALVHDGAWMPGTLPITEDEIELALLREKQARSTS